MKQLGDYIVRKSPQQTPLPPIFISLTQTKLRGIDTSSSLCSYFDLKEYIVQDIHRGFENAKTLEGVIEEWPVPDFQV